LNAYCDGFVPYKGTPRKHCYRVPEPDAGQEGLPGNPNPIISGNSESTNGISLCLSRRR
jgi:hypothetical protein